MIVNISMEYKPTKFQPDPFTIVAVEMVPHDVFRRVMAAPLTDLEQIEIHKNELGVDPDTGEAYAMILLDRDGEDGIVVQSSGYPYCRYGAYAPEIRPSVEQNIRIALERCIESLNMDKENAIRMPIISLKEKLGFPVSWENGLMQTVLDALDANSDVEGYSFEADKIKITLTAVPDFLLQL